MAFPFVEGPLRDAFRHLFNSDLEGGLAAVESYRRDAPTILSARQYRRRFASIITFRCALPSAIRRRLWVCS